jgi:aminoglycoside 3-N-acetyltransferase I
MGARAVSVRRLGQADVGPMRSLLRVFGAAFGEPETYEAKQPDDSYLQRLLADPKFVALRAMSEDEVIGGLAAYELVKFEQERSEFYIYDLAVAEAWRCRGVATALIDELRDIAASTAEFIFVQADHGDEAAIALYSKLGRREEVLHFDIQAATRG